MNSGSPAASSTRDGDETSFQRLSVTQISPEDIYKNVETLQKAFKTVNLTGTVCLKPQKDARSFGHFNGGVLLCEAFDEISRKFVDRAKIVLTRECLARLQASTEFVRELEEILESYTTYLEDKQDPGKKIPFKVERFHDICHTAKTQWIYRIAINDRILSDPWLRNSVPEVQDDLAMVYSALSHQADTTISCIANILWCVMRIADKCKWGLSHEELSALCQGIDDFNRLFEYTRNIPNDRDECFSLKEASYPAKTKFKEHLTPGFLPAVLNISNVCSLTLNKLLNGIANERSYIMAEHVHRFLSEHREITRTLSYDFASNFEWKDFGVVFAGSNSRLQSLKARNGVLTVLNRNQIPLLKLDPDSPLPAFDSQEQKFFSHVIEQIETSTTLILGRQFGGENKSAVLPALQTQRTRSTEGVGVVGTEEGGAGSGAPSASVEEGHGILKHVSEHGSPRLTKRVQWHAPVDSETKTQIHFHYNSLLWANFGAALVTVMAEYPRIATLTDVVLGPVFLWSEFLQMVVVRMMESLRLSGCLPPAGAQSLQTVSCYLHCLASASSWDSAFCCLLGTSLNDKCRLDSDLTDGVPGTRTVQSLIRLFDPLDNVFEMASYWKRSPNQLEPIMSGTPKGLTVSLHPSLCRLQALLSFGVNWINMKMLHFLASWSLEPFLLLTQWDLPILLESVKKSLNLVQPLCVVPFESGSWNSPAVCYSHLQEQRNKLEGLVKKSWTQFSKDLTKMSAEYFEETMPVGKNWKKSRRSGVPYQRNSYVEHAVVQILEPVIESTQALSTEVRLNVLTTTVNNMMEAWSDCILSQELVFSFYGAQQLQLDFGYIKSWLASEASNLNSEIQSHLLNLDVFRHLDGAIHLLMLQPRKKKQTHDDFEDELESNISTMSSSSVLSSLSGADIDSYDMEVLNDKSIPNRQKWLDLRLRGGKSKKGLLPFCLKVQEMK